MRIFLFRISAGPTRSTAQRLVTPASRGVTNLRTKNNFAGLAHHPPPASSASAPPSEARTASSSTSPSETDQSLPAYDVHPIALDALLPTMNAHSQGHATDPYNQHPEDPQCQSVRKGLARRHFVDESGEWEGDLVASYVGAGGVGLGNGVGTQEYSVVPEFASATVGSASGALTRNENQKEIDADDMARNGNEMSAMGAEGHEGYMTRVYAATAAGQDGTTTKAVPVSPEMMEREIKEKRRLALCYALDAARLSAELPEELFGRPSPSSSNPTTGSTSSTSTSISFLSDWIEPLEQRGGNPEGIGMLDQVGSASGTWRFFRLGGKQGEGFVRS